MTVLLFRLLGLLPLSVLHALGAALGRLPWWFSSAYRRRIRENLPAGLPDRRRLIGRVVAETGKQILESAWVWHRSPAEIRAAVQCADPLVEQALLDDPRPFIVLTPHLGCFEAVAQGYMARESGRLRPMIALYRVPRKAALRPLLETARARNGLELAPADLSGVRKLLRGLRGGRTLGILPDQVPSQGEGVWAPFFGRPAFTMTLPARLATATGANIAILWAERLAQGRGYLLHWERLEGPLTGDPVADATRINQALEQVILRRPEQYLWSYNRYKSPARAAAPEPAPEAPA